jgi:formylglycine-generating enzyme required for sulfatase activity
MIKQAHLAGVSLSVMFVLFFNLPILPLAGQEKKATKALKYMEVDVGGGVKMQLVYIEPGKFIMGSPKEEKEREPEELQHEVEITKGFYMGVFAVTQEQYEKVIGKNPSRFKGGRLPVDTVSWEEAMTFCRRLSQKQGKAFDLPTEAEWEYACRAGSKGPFHYGNSLSSKQANFIGDPPYPGADKGPTLGKTAPVGSYEPNAFGLYDMHGNVWQWCKDWYYQDYYKESPRRDPQGPPRETPDDWRVLRGGCWDWWARNCRSAYRSSGPVGYGKFCSGFRVVVRLPGATPDPAVNQDKDPPKFPVAKAKSKTLLKVECKLSEPVFLDKERAFESVRSKTYDIKLEGGKAVRIDLTTKDMLPRVEVKNEASKNVLASTHSRRGDRNARLVFTPVRNGTFRLVVFLSRDSLEKPGPTGAYVLTVIDNPVFGDPAKHEAALKERLAILGDLKKVLASVKNAESAKVAAPQLEKIVIRITTLEKVVRALDPLSNADEERLKAKYDPEINALRPEVGRVVRSAFKNSMGEPTFREAFDKLVKLN